MDSNLSTVQICNSALLKVGADVITSLADGSRSSNICNTLYFVLRDEVMQQAPWRFALKQVLLGVPNAAAPPFGFIAAYQLPNDCLRVWRVETECWTVVQGSVQCDKTDGINVTYVQQVTDETQWDPLFAEALALRLAMDLSLALVQSVPLKQEVEKMYNEKIALARSTNAVVGTPDRLVADLWSGARKGYDYFRAVTAGPPTPYDP